MSSFDYTDNFSGFNDLINRSTFLTEAKRSPYEKYHSSFGGVTKDLRSAGFSSAPLDTINFIRTTLYDLELISDDELAAAKQGAGFAAKKNNLLALLDAKADVIEQNKDDIAAAIESGLAQYINRATTNRGREEKYAAQKAALELAKDIKAGEDVGDAVEDTVGQLDAAESELADSLQMSKEDPTTFIEIKIRDADRVEDVGNIVSKYANEDGLDISGDTVQFSVDPDTPLAAAVATHGIDKIEAALKRDVDKISDSVVVVMAPDEDYEQIDDDEQEGPSLANSPGGAPSSYAAGEEGGGITEVEDEEGDDVESVYDKQRKDHILAKGKAGHFQGRPDGFYAQQEGIPYEAPKKEYDDGPRPGKLKELDDLKFAMDGDNFFFKDVKEFVSKQPGGGMHGTNKEQQKKIVMKFLNSRTGGNWEYEKVGGREGSLYPWLPGQGNLADATYYDKVVRVGEEVEDNEEFDGLELDHFLTKEQPEDYIPSTDYEDVLDRLVKKDKEEHAKRLAGENEEDFKYSPMLDSYQTSTAGYLTEQAASDNRNKKTEVKKETFKEKYKPKTHWQLEELRRYGL
jgi:hypothetical protein